MSYFLDTYALIEIAKGNENFNRLLDSEMFTSIFNLYEFYFVLLRDFDENIAREFFYRFKTRLTKTKDKHIFEASKFRLINSKKGLSYADCIGYVIAKDLGVRFLTGDKEFRGLENVEFMK